MTRLHSIASLTAAAAAVATSLLGACASDGLDGPAASEPEVEGALVAKVDLSPSHRLELWRFDDDTVHLREVGELEDAPLDLDLDELANLSPVQRFQALAGPSVALPPALLEAEKAASEHALAEADLSTDLTDPGPSGEALDSHAGDGAAGAGARVAWDWVGDAKWWQDNFCSNNAVDASWCPTNVGWADGGTRYASYYEAVCIAASFDQSARFTVKRWNGAAWEPMLDATLAPRHWQRWIAETAAEYTSRCESVAAGGDARVHYVWRARWATPFSFARRSDYPRSVEYSNDRSDDLQGVTNNGTYWWFTNAEHANWPSTFCCDANIWRRSKNGNLADSPTSVVHNPWEGRWNHFGDLSYGAGFLFVALEPSDGNGQWGGVGVFTAEPNLQVRDAQAWPYAGESDQGGTSSWVAYNPVDNLLYSSTGDGKWLDKYSWSVSYSNGWHLSLGFVGRIRIRNKYGAETAIPGISGGEFSATGKLYVVDQPGGYLRVLDVYNGRQQGYWKARSGSNDADEEMEGLTVWNLDDGVAPGIGGQIHVQSVDNDDFSTDNFTFMHWGTSSGEAGLL